jgi:hypothetical protein
VDLAAVDCRAVASPESTKRTETRSSRFSTPLRLVVPTPTTLLAPSFPRS